MTCINTLIFATDKKQQQQKKTYGDNDNVRCDNSIGNVSIERDMRRVKNGMKTSLLLKQANSDNEIERTASTVERVKKMSQMR